MIKYQLIEKNPNTEESKNLSKQALKKCSFFSKDDDEYCYKLKWHIDYMLKNEISELDLYLARRETDVPYFFCKHFYQVGDKIEGGCGKMCEGYQPRNGKSGACRHYGNTYEKTDRLFTLKINKKHYDTNKKFNK